MHLHSAICHLSSLFWKMDKLRAPLNFFFQLITQLLHKLYTCCKLCYFEILYLNQFSFLYVENSLCWFHVAQRPLLQNFNSIHVLQLGIYCIFCSFQILLMWNALRTHSNSLKPSLFLSLTHRPQIIVQFFN